MAWQKFTLDAEPKNIKEVLQVCAGKYEKRGIGSQQSVERVILNMKKWMVNIQAIKSKLI